MDGDTFVGCRFYLQIEGVSKAVFAEISGLQVETEIFEYAEGGNNGFVHRLPGPIRVGNITLKRGLAGSDELFKWYMKIVQGKLDDRRNLSVLIYNTEGEELQRWNFIKAYPVRWVGPSLDANNSSVAIETFELAHAGLG
ncbi:MAG TPA: phage tail protein [Kouleothrix sp.]|uniref:phage tail protein n=1 Tax=Kouleothrix sp. TaxID=2779161 RepID=UPI002D0B58F2|nr:phage tail protein [Kouleothrix sp.]